MRRIIFLLPVFCTGCLYLPVADVLDRLHPSPVRPENDYPNSPPLTIPAPSSPPAGTFLPPQPGITSPPAGNDTAPALPAITPFAPDPSLPNT